MLTESTAVVTPATWVQVSFSANSITATRLTAISCTTAERLNATLIPRLLINRNMIRFPTV